MVQLPSYYGGNSLDFSPVQNALSQVTAQNNANRQYGLEQQQSARADQQLALQKQQVGSELKSAGLQQEKLLNDIMAGVSQGALSVQDPTARAAIWKGFVGAHPEMTAKLQQYGVDPANPDSGLQFFANYGQNPLDIQAKKAQIAATNQSIASSKQEMELARAPKIQTIGQGVFGATYGQVNPLTGDVIKKIDAGDDVGGEMVKNLADGITTGKQPPVVGQGQGTGAKINAAVKSELQKRGFDLTTANLQYESAHKQVLSLNGPQMVRYTGLAQSVISTIDRVNELARQMQNSGITGLNAAKIATLKNTAGNTPSGQLATQYEAAVNTLKEEFANLAQGGYAPTEAAWGLADKQINSNYGVDQLNASLGEVQRLLRYRLDAIPNIHTLGPGASNPYVNGGVAPQIGHGGQPAAGPAPAPAAAPAAQPSAVPNGRYRYNPQTGGLDKVE